MPYLSRDDIEKIADAFVSVLSPSSMMISIEAITTVAFKSGRRTRACLWQ